MSIITLCTDFGTRDEYVGVVKGVILGINPSATLVDISHQIPPQGIIHAGEVLKAAFSWFAPGSIHLTVVDPGVGSERAIVAARFSGHTFIAPDNGLLTIVWGEKEPDAIVLVQNSRYFLHPVSPTFHGRDIMAPVAAHLSAGLGLNELGPAIPFSRLKRQAQPQPEWNGDAEMTGQVISSDYFGNLRTNIEARHLERLTHSRSSVQLTVSVGEIRISGVSSTYSQKDQGSWIALINSRNQLEIAVNGGRAADMLPDFRGMVVRVGLGSADIIQQ